jgi:hypothetical protein
VIVAQVRAVNFHQDRIFPENQKAAARDKPNEVLPRSTNQKSPLSQAELREPINTNVKAPERKPMNVRNMIKAQPIFAGSEVGSG